MLSEERVKLMTRMAMFEKKEGRKMQPAERYTKKDYLSLCTMRGFVVGSLVYAAVYLGVLAWLFSAVVVNISMMLFLLCIILGVLCYVLYLFFYLRIVRRRAELRYRQGRELVKQYRGALQRLLQFYEKEEALKSPEGWN